MNNYIKIKNLTKKYEKNKSIKVLNDITFNFEPGKTYSIVGPSGSGKSTLLNLLSLIDNPTSGSIEINSNKIKQNNKVENDLIRAKKIGIIYQDKNLLSDFTALENVYLPNLLISKEKQNSIELAKKLKNNGITVNCMHPGIVSTNIAQDRIGLMQFIIKTVLKLKGISPNEGADTIIFLATDKSVSHISSKYFIKRKISKTSHYAENISYAAKLWKASETIVKSFKF